MLLAIDDHKKIGDLQDHFNKCFPHLMMRFYSHPQRWNEPQVPDEEIAEGKTIGDVSRQHRQDILDIKSWFQAGKVEHDLRTLYGLNVRIFRRENGNWVQVARTDSLAQEGEDEHVASQLSKNNIITGDDSPGDEELSDFLRLAQTHHPRA